MQKKELEAAMDRLGVSGAKRVAITGVGAADIKEPILGLPTKHVDEFVALSRGASRSARKANCLVVSIGTGTSFVRVTPLRSWHVGGTGLGGGTLQGLAKRLCNIEDMAELQTLAEQCDLTRVDLQLKDICSGEISDLQPTTTVANLQKTDESVQVADLAAGLCNMIFESIGVMAAFAVKRSFTRTIVLVGTITDWRVAQRSLDEVAGLHPVSFIVPDRAPYVTAIGATLAD